MAILEEILEERKITPRQAAIRDMREEGLNTAVLELRKTVIVEEIEEFAYRSIDDGRILNGITPKSAERFLECRGKRIKRTILSETHSLPYYRVVDYIK